MKIKSRSTVSGAIVIILMLIITFASTRLKADSGSCGGATTILPFTDIAGNPFFCEIAEAYFSGLTNGTTATTYSPTQNVTRDQMAAFITRTMDQSLKRGSQRAALKRFWTPASPDSIGITALGGSPNFVAADGADIWVSDPFGSVSRVRASDGKLLGTWSGALFSTGVLVAKGLIFVAASGDTGMLYSINPTLPPGQVSTVSNSLPMGPLGIAFDGERVWTSSVFSACVSIVTLNPVTVTTVSNGFSGVSGILYDGSNIWVTDFGTDSGKLFKLDSNGGIIQEIPVGFFPNAPVFDGTNIWVPNDTFSTVVVVRASTGAIIATLSDNGLNHPVGAAFDGERVLILNSFGNSVSLWKASDLTPLGFAGIGESPRAVCSDGLNFWITLPNNGRLVRF